MPQLAGGAWPLDLRSGQDHDRVIATTDDPPHPWPDDEPTIVRAAPKKRGRLARIGRVFGDAALTIGMSKGMTGDNTTVSPDYSMTNTLLFSEGTKKGREADPPSGD